MSTEIAAMDSLNFQPGKAVGRPQAADLTDRILSQTLASITAEGFHGFKIGRVAANCKTSKQAIYRRWPSKVALTAAAIEHALAGANPAIPEGPLQAALEITLGGVVNLLSNTPFGGAIRALVGVQSEPQLAEAMARVEHSRRQLILKILARAQDEGEYPAQRDRDQDVDTLLGAIYFRFLIRNMPVDTAFAASVIANWCAGLPAPLPITPPLTKE